MAGARLKPYPPCDVYNVGKSGWQGLYVSRADFPGIPQHECALAARATLFFA
ncbi:hypothetical protein M752DRAFT_275310 [Aspergillus phoenicis ATCC 13157]|nr:hypothetical protein M752DRAFT_275310 [Aspergillus phoenicis ATCC 13157]